MIEGKTSTGYEFVINDEALDDAELVDDFVEIQDGKNMHTKDACIRLLGVEGQKKLYEHCRAESGRVKFTDMFRELMEIMQFAKDSKNS